MFLVIIKMFCHEELSSYSNTTISLIFFNWTNITLKVLTNKLWNLFSSMSYAEVESGSFFQKEIAQFFKITICFKLHVKLIKWNTRTGWKNRMFFIVYNKTVKAILDNSQSCLSTHFGISVFISKTVQDAGKKSITKLFSIMDLVTIDTLCILILKTWLRNEHLFVCLERVREHVFTSTSSKGTHFKVAEFSLGEA